MNNFLSICKPIKWLAAILLVVVAAGCNSGSSNVAPAADAGTSSGPAAVNLLTAGDFAILANTAVTYNGTAAASAVTGDVGISPSFAAAITGFGGYAVDTTNDFATASEVVAAPSIANSGRIYAPDFTGGGPGANGLTPAKMTAAQNDMLTAYNDAKNRTAATGAFLDAGTAGEIGGLTLAPGVYTWVTNPNVAITMNVTLTGTATDVWIFQIPGTLNQAVATSVILGSNAKAKNIFWQVAGGVTLGTTAHMEGVILSGTAITLGTDATANSRLLAQSAVTFRGTVTQPAP